jgi:hypothetical protein
MKDVYKIIKSTSIFPWNRFEVWIKGLQWTSYGTPREEVVTRCIHKTSTEQKAQEYITYWEEVANFRGENNE